MLAQEGESTVELKTAQEVDPPERGFDSNLEESRRSIDTIIPYAYLTGWRLHFTTVG